MMGKWYFTVAIYNSIPFYDILLFLLGDKYFLFVMFFEKQIYPKVYFIWSTCG